MAYDIADLFAQRERERFAMHSRHFNEQMVRVLKAIGYDVGFCRGEGQYLYDREGDSPSRPVERVWCFRPGGITLLGAKR